MKLAIIDFFSGVDLYEGYGSTEAGIVTVLEDITAHSGAGMNVLPTLNEGPIAMRRIVIKPRPGSNNIVATIRDGRAGTPMPPWKNLLGEDDIAWLVDTLLETAPTP